MQILINNVPQDLPTLCTQIRDLLEAPQEDLRHLTDKLLPLLVDLFRISLVLNPKYVDFDFEEFSTESGEVKKILTSLFKGEGLYKEVFDPIEDEEPVTFSLVNDLCEIHESLSVYLMEANLNLDAAEWNFNQNFRLHIYQHVLNVMKVLYITYVKYE
jgi:hypothetical protein